MSLRWHIINHFFLYLTIMTAAHLCGVRTSVVFTRASSCSSHLFCWIPINVSPPTRHPQLTSAAASLSHLHLQPWGLNMLPVYGFYVSKRMTRECWQRHTFIPFIHFVYFPSVPTVKHPHAWSPTQIIPSISPISYLATFTFSHDTWAVVDVKVSLLMEQDSRAYSLHRTHQR